MKAIGFTLMRVFFCVCVLGILFWVEPFDQKYHHYLGFDLKLNLFCTFGRSFLQQFFFEKGQNKRKITKKKLLILRHTRFVYILYTIFLLSFL